MSFVAWSYSRLTSYETCPKKYHAESVAKSVPFVKNEAAAYGDEVHKAFELFFKDNKPLPFNLKHWTPTLKAIAAAPGEKIVEARIALDVNWNPVEWYAPDAWLRVKSDLTIINQPAAAIFDWKTGKQRDDETQLQLNAAVTFVLDPEITDINMAYLWLPTRIVTPFKMNARQAPNFWAGILKRVGRYQEAHDRNEFPARPGWLCRYCPVKTCPYWERKA